MPPVSHLCMNPMVALCCFSKWILADIHEEQWVPITVLLKEGNLRRCISVPELCHSHPSGSLLEKQNQVSNNAFKNYILCFINVGQYRTPGFPSGSVGKKSTYNAGATGDVSSIPGSGRSPEVRNGNPLQYSCLENPRDRGAWQATVRRVTKTRTRLNDWACLLCILPLWM